MSIESVAAVVILLALLPFKSRKRVPSIGISLLKL